MPPIDYWVLRTIRRHMPQRVVDFMLDRALYLKPGRDTSEPERIAGEYAERAAAGGVALDGRSVCVVGYGGGLGVGLHLLELGAGRVILQDPFAPTRKAHDQTIAAELRARYFTREGDPDPARLEIVHEHLEPYARRRPRSVDLVVSSSVLEHVSDVPAVVAACAALTAPSGLNVHVIDLRDHFFKHPFEMLCYDERTWRRWLNASNNLNRLRLPAYRAAFERAFDGVEVEVLERLDAEFRRARARIRPEFLTGDDAVDSAAIIRIEARSPRRQS